MNRQTQGTFHVDSRSELTGTTDPVVLEAIIEAWPTPVPISSAVGRYWERAAGLFRSGAIEYENFTEAVRVGFLAVEAALRHHVSDLIDDGERVTLGNLIRRADGAGRLRPSQNEWLSRYALRFRNELTHSDGKDPLVLTPAMSATMLTGIARFLADLSDSKTDRDQPIAT